MADITFKIHKEYGVISEGSKGWNKEINLVSWNGREPKIDIRDWNQDHSQMGKGITLNDVEARVLLKILEENLKE